MIVGSQIRAARAVLGWSIADLSKVSGIGTTTLKRYEWSDDLSSALPHYLLHLTKIFEHEGITFLNNEKSEAGILFKA
jgi:transcriptional regulator with XRE-family HTH domain